ncbi:dual specificity protein kinase TTK-like isoform X2 [Mytilus californianus]|nr:dual specificity protein kinase TTK-like isoform X2 [Mytilus californianus]
MTSMSSLKSKLHRLKKEDTSEVTDYKTWMKKITDCGNRAEDWLEYTTYMRHNLNFNDRFQAHNFLSDLYEKAFRAIDGKENKDNEAFAHLFIDFAEVKSEQLLSEDAIQLLTEARNIVKKYSIVHIASAELEIKEGNISKARNILNKARLFKFEPTDLLVEALRKLDAGETVLLSPRHRRYSSGHSKVNLSDDSQSIFHGVPEGNLQEHIGPDEMETAPVMMESHKEKYVTVRANSCRPAMRSYSSTPEMRSLSNFQWKRTDIGVPQRVRKLNLPFTATAEEEEEEGVEDMDTMSGFTPLEPQASSTFVSMTTAQSSGYQSMMETTIPLETGNQFENHLSGFHSGKPAFDLSGIHPQKQTFDLTGIHPQQQTCDLSGILSQRQTCDLSGTQSKKHTNNPLGKQKDTPSCEISGIESMKETDRQTCDLSDINQKSNGIGIQPVKQNDRLTCNLYSIQSDMVMKESVKDISSFQSDKSMKEPMKLDNVSLLQPNGRPQIMKSQVLPNPKPNSGAPKVVTPNQVSGNPTPSRGAPRVLTPNQVSGNPTPSRGAPRMVTPNQMSAFPTHSKGAPRVLTPNQVSANPTPSRGAPRTVTLNQVSANLIPNRKVPEIPTPNRTVPIEPTPSKHVMSDRLSNVPICATPSAVQQTSIPCTPSVMQDVETITVNNVVYMILDMLGKGGSSKVYHVHDSKPPSKAIKVVNLNDANEEIVNGYKNEVKLLLQLQYCPKVIKIYDYEYRPEENKLYIVMEYGNCDFAQFLKDKIKEDCKLSDHLIKYYWESMLMAVHALHKEGIIHSDLKPSNFIIIGGALKLIDFGIAKSVQPDKTSVLTEMQVGTLNYMSPESIADYGLDEKPMYKIGVKSDVWSLGCILYNMVYGFTPFQRINKQFAKLQAITNSSYVIHFPEIEDKRLLDVMKKCLIRDPKVRPSIEDLLQHPYLKREKKEEASVVDKRIERLVERLADKVSSPNTLRSLLRSEILKGISDRECPENKENVH